MISPLADARRHRNSTVQAAPRPGPDRTRCPQRIVSVDIAGLELYQVYWRRQAEAARFDRVRAYARSLSGSAVSGASRDKTVRGEKQTGCVQSAADQLQNTVD